MRIKPPVSSQIPQLRRLWQEAFADGDGFLDAFFSAGFSEDRCLTLWQGEMLAAALYWFGCTCRDQKAAYVYAVATAKAYRGQGLCHRLMEELHRALKEQGYAMTVLVPGSEALFRFYGGMGYECFGGIREFTCGAGKPVPVHPISPEEYAALRLEYLPDGSVIQQGENLDFLRTQASFFKGEDFLLTAVSDGDRMFCPEILGNTETAEGIVTSLSCREGRFRTPGRKPFAMYKPLLPCEKPVYFGYAFD